MTSSSELSKSVSEIEIMRRVGREYRDGAFCTFDTNDDIGIVFVQVVGGDKNKFVLERIIAKIIRFHYHHTMHQSYCSTPKSV